jgi:tagatose-1,6-bisphosphate aldolase
MITHLQLEHEINEKSTNVLKQNAVKRTISDLNEEDECILLENEVQPESNEDGQKSAKRQKKLIDALVDFIIKTDTPISIVENDEF